MDSPKPLKTARVISRPTLNSYKEAYPDAAEALKRWEGFITSIEFHTFEELNQQINTVDLVNGLLVFNIVGNRYRLIVGVAWGGPILFLKHFLTHKEYDAWSEEQRKAKAKKKRGN